MAVLVILSFASTIFVFHDPWALISFPSLHVFELIGCFATALALSRGRIDTAGYCLVFVLTVGASGIVILAGQRGSVMVLTGIPAFLLVVIMTALILPRRIIFPMSILCAVIFGVILFGFELSGSKIAGIDASQVTTANILAMLTASAFLWRLRGEFDDRLTAMSASLLQTELARKQAEEARQRAEHADKVKSQFLANMSHELRTPLNAIIGYDEAMLGGMVGTFAPEQTKLLGHIQNNSRRLLSLIDDVLDLSKVEAGSIQMYVAPVYPRKTIQDIVDNLQGIAQQQGTTLTAHFTDAVPEVVMNDNKKLQQILTNLISNAIKFTPKGSVSIVVDSADKTNWQFKVCDTGVGMPPDAPSYIFEPFRQVDGAESRRFKGTGLGLAITKRFIDYMGGSIAVETELGKGSTFTIVLPRVVSSEKPAAQQSA
ncbi:MAG: hypothetical protein IT324_14065 [Anaerolineae bacterium]|nr:hypothetical protein [Anaerolineae bacterium]